jgi:hypothetical protein
MIEPSKSKQFTLGYGGMGCFTLAVYLLEALLFMALQVSIEVKEDLFKVELDECVLLTCFIYTAVDYFVISSMKVY